MYKNALSVALLAILLLVLGLPLRGEDETNVLTNDSVLQMFRWKMKPAEIVALIDRSGENTIFTLTPESIQMLAKAGATPLVLDAMYRATMKASQHIGLSSAISQTPSSPKAITTTPQPPPQPQAAPPSPQPPSPAVPTISGAVPAAGAPVVSLEASVQPRAPVPLRPSSTGSDDERLTRAKIPLVRAQPPHPQQPKSALLVYQLDWNNGIASPGTIYESGDSLLRLTNANTILYTYQFEVNEIKGSGDDLSQWAKLITDTTKLLPSGVPREAYAPEKCQLKKLLRETNRKLTDIRTKIQQMVPDRLSGGNYKSIPLDTSEKAWADIRPKYDGFEEDVTAIQHELSKEACSKESDLSLAVELVLDEFPPMRDRVDEIQKKADAPWQDLSHRLDRTSGYDTTVAELYNNAATEAKSKVFHLERGFNILTLSGGFLVTKLQARSYSSVAQPVAPPAGSPPNTLPGSQNVLSVNGLGSGMRPALVALFNYHDPFSWPLNRPNFGLALSAGPVIDVANGQADTTRFGVFVGGSRRSRRRRHRG